jgi:L-threonylcarbamoyladenylate synthase
MKFLSVDEAVEALKAGELVVVPTETVYGLAADGLNNEAVMRLYEVKERPQGKPIMLQVADLEMLKSIVEFIPETALRLIKKYWPGPVSLILSKRPEVSSILSAGGKTIGIRMPDQPLTLEIIRKFGKPIAVPSANLSGRESPKTVAEVESQLGSLTIAGIVDGGESKFGIESTIVDCHNDQIKILREGAISGKEILDFLSAGETALNCKKTAT